MVHVTPTPCPQWHNYILLEVDAKVKVIPFCRLDCYELNLDQYRCTSLETVEGIDWRI